MFCACSAPALDYFLKLPPILPCQLMRTILILRNQWQGSFLSSQGKQQIITADMQVPLIVRYSITSGCSLAPCAFLNFSLVMFINHHIPQKVMQVQTDCAGNGPHCSSNSKAFVLSMMACLRRSLLVSFMYISWSRIPSCMFSHFNIGYAEVTIHFLFCWWLAGLACIIMYTTSNLQFQ